MAREVVTGDISAACRKRVAWRLLPFLFLAYVAAYLDRANVGFANAPMSADLHFSNSVFGFGAGVFFVGYVLLEIPGALIVERWSARLWISRILITWGLCTTFMALIHTPAQFYTVRFLLGCAEAGFYPGVIVYLTHWFTERDRARATAGFVMAAPVSLALGGPLSAAILRIHWPALAAWRWLFIVQGIPAVALGLIAWRYLTDWPKAAGWLPDAEREWLTEQLKNETRAKISGVQTPWWQLLKNTTTLSLAAAHFLANVAGYSFIFWLPVNIRDSAHLSPGATNVVAGLPFVVAVVALWVAARSSDRSGERKMHACVPMLVAACCVALTSAPGMPPFAALGLIVVAGASIFAWIPGFWALPTLSLSRDAAATSVGFINAVGNLGGFVGPFVTGLLRDSGHPKAAFAAVIAIAYVGCAALIWVAPVRSNGDAISRPL
jgi:ACS family tartrate transporter-like MFS transporter